MNTGSFDKSPFITGFFECEKLGLILIIEKTHQRFVEFMISTFLRKGIYFIDGKSKFGTLNENQNFWYTIRIAEMAILCSAFLAYKDRDANPIIEKGERPAPMGWPAG